MSGPDHPSEARGRHDGPASALHTRRAALLLATVAMVLVAGWRAAPAGGRATQGPSVRTVRVGLPHPFTVKGLLIYTEGDRIDGFARRLMDAVAKKAGLEVEYVEYTREIGPEVLMTREVDVVCPLSIQEARLEVTQYTSPIMVAGGAAYGLPGSAPANSAAALRGKRVIVPGAGIAEQWCAERSVAYRVGGAVRNCLRAVLDGEADYAVTTIPGARLTEQLNSFTGLVEYPIDDATFRRAYAFGVRRGDTELLETLDGALARVRARGEFDDLYERWAAEYQPAPSSGLVPRSVLVWVIGLGGGLLMVALVAYALTQRRLVRRTRALLRSEERFRGFVEGSAEAVWSFELRPEVPVALPPERQVELVLEQGVVTDCNQAAAELYGRPEPARLRGATLRSILGEQDPLSAALLRQFVDAGYRLTGVESQLSAAPGQRTVINSLVGVVERDRLSRVWVTQIDVTARRAAELSLRESEAQYRLLTENLAALTYTYVVYHDGRRERRFVTSQLAEWQKVFPWLLPGEAFERSYGPYIHPDDLLSYHAAVARSREQKQLLDAEFRLLAIDGAYRVLHTKVVPSAVEGGTQWTALVSDVTSVRAGEQARRDTERRYREVFERSHDAIVIFNPADGRVLDCNDRACDLYGFTRDELLGMDIRSLAVDPNVSARRIAETLERGFHEDFPCHQRRKDGVEIEVDISASVIEVASRDAILIMVRDITERTRAEEQRRALERDLREARRLESLGALAGGVAHDFNNLLAAILGNADLALHHLPADSPAREHLRQVVAASRSAAGLTRQMLVYAGGGSVTPEPVDLAELARDVVQMMAVTVGPNARLSSRLDHSLPPIRGDRVLLGQLLMNLVTNAVDAVGARAGEIVVSVYVIDVERSRVKAAHAAPEFAGGTCVCLEVLDTGGGMPEAVRERMFEPFFSTKFTGRGLGLAAALGTVRAHQGAIEVESREGFGTTVRVFLPYVPEPAVPKPSPAPAGARHTPVRGDDGVLVVDDEPLVRGVVAATLAAAGWRIFECADGDQAIRSASEVGASLAAAIIDLTMPGCDGVEVGARLREQRPGLPLVIMSGYSDIPEGGGLSRVPGAVFLAKPFAADDLLGAIVSATRAVEPETPIRA